MRINFETPETFSITKRFTGDLEDGRTFTIVAEWNDWDGWSIDNLECIKGELSEEDEQKICNYFLDTMN